MKREAVACEEGRRVRPEPGGLARVAGPGQVQRFSKRRGAARCEAGERDAGGSGPVREEVDRGPGFCQCMCRGQDLDRLGTERWEAQAREIDDGKGDGHGGRIGWVTRNVKPLVERDRPRLALGRANAYNGATWTLEEKPVRG